jgi:hypothetical protein
VAVTSAGAALTSQQRIVQLGIRAAAMRNMSELGGLWVPGDRETGDRFIRLASTLIGQGYRESAGSALDYFSRFRILEGIAGRSNYTLPPALRLEDIAPSLYVTAFSAFARAARAGMSPEAAKLQAMVGAIGTASRLVMNGGRDAITGAVANDPRARGYVRVTSGQPCAFCAMLASRVKVLYRSERTASFEAHDHCSCTAEPVYEGSKLPASNEAASKLWKESKGDPKKFRELVAERGLNAEPAKVSAENIIGETA